MPIVFVEWTCRRWWKYCALFLRWRTNSESAKQPCVKQHACVVDSLCVNLLFPIYTLFMFCSPYRRSLNREKTSPFPGTHPTQEIPQSGPFEGCARTGWPPTKLHIHATKKKLQTSSDTAQVHQRRVWTSSVCATRTKWITWNNKHWNSKASCLPSMLQLSSHFTVSDWSQARKHARSRWLWLNWLEKTEGP